MSVTTRLTSCGFSLVTFLLYRKNAVVVHAKPIVWASVLLVGITASLEASPINFFSDQLTNSPGLNCLPDCVAPDWFLADAPPLTAGAHTSAASLHADIPPPWNGAKGVATSSIASLYADVPPPWANLIGQIGIPSQKSNTIDIPVAASSNTFESASNAAADVASGSSNQTANTPVSFLDNDPGDGGLIADLIDIGIAELGLGSTNQSESGNQTSAVPETTAAVVAGPSSIQDAVPFMSSPPNNVPEPTAVALVGLGLFLQLVLANGRITKSNRRDRG